MTGGLLMIRRVSYFRDRNGDKYTAADRYNAVLVQISTLTPDCNHSKGRTQTARALGTASWSTVAGSIDHVSGFQRTMVKPTQ